MFTFISNVLPTVLGVIVVVIGALNLFFSSRVKGKSSSSAVFDAVQFVTRMLPSLIRLSESANAGKGGEVKKAFVLDYVENMLVGRGLVFTDEIREQISTTIDGMVGLTKEMHTEGSTKNGNQQNDIDGVTGLRVNS